MRTYKDETGLTVKAENYQKAAEKMYGIAKDINGQKATYAHTHKGYANVNVYPEGAKVGNYYGVSETTPQRHILTIIK